MGQIYLILQCMVIDFGIVVCLNVKCLNESISNYEDVGIVKIVSH